MISSELLDWIQNTVDTLIEMFMGPALGPSGSCQPQMVTMLAPWTLLCGIVFRGLHGNAPSYIQDIINPSKAEDIPLDPIKHVSWGFQNLSMTLMAYMHFHCIWPLTWYYLQKEISLRNDVKDFKWHRLIFSSNYAYGIYIIYIYRIMHVLECWAVSVLTRGLFWCLFPELWSNEGYKYQNNMQVSTETARHVNTYIILFLIWHNESTNEDKNDDLYTSSPCLTCSIFALLMTSQSTADVTMTRQL